MWVGGHLMALRKDQPPLDSRYFSQNRKMMGLLRCDRRAGTELPGTKDGRRGGRNLSASRLDDRFSWESAPCLPRRDFEAVMGEDEILVGLRLMAVEAGG